MRAWLAKVRPPSIKISLWYIRLAPPLSTNEISGNLFSNAICCTRRPFFKPMGATVPPLTALSLAEMMQRLPATTPIPTMEPPPITNFLPSSSCMFSPARRLSSKNGVPRSSRRATRSRGSNCLRFSNLSRLDSDSAMTSPSRRWTSANRACMRWALAAKASDVGLILERSAGIRKNPCVNVWH